DPLAAGSAARRKLDELATDAESDGKTAGGERPPARGHAPAMLHDEGGSSNSCLRQDRKSTRLNSSHVAISYAVFCLKKKNRQPPRPNRALCSSLVQDVGASLRRALGL